MHHCPECLHAIATEDPKHLQQEARKRERERKSQRVEEVLTWIDTFKTSRGCDRCGETDPRALDCHHQDPTAKALNITALARRQPTLAVVAQALMKCAVLCASCQRKGQQAPRTAARVPTAQIDAQLADLLDAPGSAKSLELRRASLAEALKSAKDALEALPRGDMPPREVAKQRAELDDRRRTLSVALMKLDAEIASSTSVTQPTHEDVEDLP